MIIAGTEHVVSCVHSAFTSSESWDNINIVSHKSDVKYRWGPNTIY
jgi:hypothetical protein